MLHGKIHGKRDCFFCVTWDIMNKMELCVNFVAHGYINIDDSAAGLVLIQQDTLKMR